MGELGLGFAQVLWRHQEVGPESVERGMIRARGGSIGLRQFELCLAHSQQGFGTRCR